LLPLSRIAVDFAASLLATPAVRVIKVSDFIGNGVALIHTTGLKLRRLAGKYGPLVLVLRKLTASPDTPLDIDVRDRIAAQLGRAALRFDLNGR
jgi:hypothetical protein